MARIIGHEYQISRIFSPEFEFVIPPYQRPYAWTTEEAGELLAGGPVCGLLSQHCSDASWHTRPCAAGCPHWGAQVVGIYVH